MGYHAINICLHAITSLLFFKLCSKLWRRQATALIAALLFAVHPIHTEAVAGLVGRAELGASIFFLLALMAYERHCANSSNHSWQWKSLLCASIAMLFKETGITIIGVCAVLHFFVWGNTSFREMLADKTHTVSENNFLYNIGIIWSIIFVFELVLGMIQR